MITRRNITSLPIISALGSDENFDRHAKILHFGAVNETIKTDSGKIIYRYLMANAAKEPIRQSFIIDGKSYQPKGWQISSIYLRIVEELENSLKIAVLVEVNNGRKVLRLRPEEIYFKGRYIKQEGEVLPCTMFIYTHGNDPTDWVIAYLSSKGRQNLMVRLFLLNIKSQFFLPVYPDPADSQLSDGATRIWAIRYPEGLKSNEKYLATQFAEERSIPPMDDRWGLK